MEPNNKIDGDGDVGDDTGLKKINKIKFFKGNWSKKDVDNSKDSLFVFGDNDLKFGCRGQSVIRFCSNAIGIATKKRPSNSKNSFYMDSEFEINKEKIDKSIKELIEKSKNYKYIVLPSNKLGTGLSQLNTKAPKTFKYLQSEIDNLSNIL